MQNNFNISTIKKHTHMKNSGFEIKKYLVMGAMTLAIVLGGHTFVYAQIKGTSDKTSATIKGTPDKTSATIKGTPSQNAEVKNVDTPEKLEDPLGDNITIEGLLLKLLKL
jgi:hypothetical protein